MRIAWLGTYRENSSMRGLRQALAQLENVSFYGISNPNSTQEIIEKGKTRRIKRIIPLETSDYRELFDLGSIFSGDQYDVMIYDFHLPGPDAREEWNRWIMPESNISALRVGIITDAWEKMPRQRLKEWKFDVILMIQGSKEIIREYSSEYACMYYPFPVSFDAKIFNIDHEKGKDIECLFAGSVIKDFYPLRWEMLNFLKTEGSKNIILNQKYPVEIYASYLKRARILPTCSSIYKYLLAKYWEAMACGTLLIADKPNEIPGTKLESGFNYVEVDLGNFAGKIRHYIANPEEKESIVENAYKYVMENHTSEIRAGQLKEILKKELEKRKKI